MLDRRVVVVACGWAVLVGCGGNATSTGEQPLSDGDGAGGDDQGAPPAGHAGSAQSGAGGAAAQPDPPDPGPGTCAKVCVPMVTFVVDSPVPAEELRAGTLRACRNGDGECFEGELPGVDSIGNTVDFHAPGGWQGPAASSGDDWKTIHFTWSGLESQPPFRDGDRFQLTFEGAGGPVDLVDRTVQFETMHDCSGSCEIAFFDLRGQADGG